MDGLQTHKLLIRSREILLNNDKFVACDIEAALRTLARDLDVKVGQLLGTIRLATSGQKVSPPLFESIEILGKDRVIILLDEAIEMLS